MKSVQLTAVPANPGICEFAAGGLPLPAGAVRPDQAFAATGPDSKQLPTQCEPLAYWPDGSVKWLLVEAILPPRVDRITLEPIHSRQVGPADSAFLKVEKDRAGYRADTGPLRFHVGPDAGGFLAEAVLVLPDGKTIELLRNDGRRWQLDYYIADRPGRIATHALMPAGTMDRSRLEIDAVELERSGPIHCTIVLRGRYLHERLGRSFPGRGAIPSRVDIRIHAFAGQSYIILEHTFVYEGNPESDFLAACGLRIPLNLTGEKGKRITAVGGEWRTERWMYANPLFATDPPETPNPDGAFPYWRAGGVVQDSYDHYKTWKVCEPTGGPLVVDEARRCAGWIDITDEKWGCAVGIVDMAENYPASLEASNEDATVTAWLYPPQAHPADLRRYTQIFGTGEAEPYPGKATGISKTHQLWVYFHAGRDEEARTNQIAASLNGLRLLTAEPKYIAETGVLGPYRPADPQAFAKIEEFATNVTDFMLAHQQRYRWFGLFDYGDFQSVYRYRSELNPTDNLRWMNDWGRWGWVNDEGLITYWLMWQFLRTGRPEYFKAAAAMTAHVRDIDVKHTQAYPWGPAGQYEYRDVRGFGHRHNVHHWGDAYLGPRVANPLAWRLHYYMTGDGRTRDAIDEVYQANVLESKVWAGCDSMPTALYALYAKYEMTGGVEYKRKIEAFLAEYCDFARQHGYFPSNSAWDFAADQPKEAFSGNGAESFFWHSFGMGNFLIEWYSLTGDEKLKEALVKHAYATLTVTGWSKDFCHFQMLAIGWALTGDEVFGRRIAELLAQHVDDTPIVPRQRAEWFGPEAYVGCKTISMIGFVMSGLPYVTGAVPDEKSLWPDGVPNVPPTPEPE